MVDLEEPRSLRPTIGWPASGAMRHPASQLLRIPLLRLYDKSLDGPQRFVLVALKVAKMVLVGEFDHLQEP